MIITLGFQFQWHNNFLIAAFRARQHLENGHNFL